jgi:type IV secretory pathway component VirB8
MKIDGQGIKCFLTNLLISIKMQAPISHGNNESSYRIIIMLTQAIEEMCYRQLIDEMHDSNTTNSFRQSLKYSINISPVKSISHHPRTLTHARTHTHTQNTQTYTHLILCSRIIIRSTDSYVESV